jgi:poly(glycerol-phosphate) alpha-glucosyltransferase
MRKFKLENEIAIIPNGIELPSAAPTGLPPWDKVVESGRKVLLLLGRIHPKKGIPSLLKAWAHIQSLEKRGQRSEEWVLAIAGWDQGGHETELKRLATKLGLVWTDIRDQKVEPRNQLSAFSLVFLGPQFGVAKEACYAHCDGFILPSFSEGLPTVILEAWARAKPAVMTPECNLPEGFAAGAALRIDPDTESVTMGLEEFFGMTEAERAAMGSRGRSLVADRFAWPRISQQMIEVYQWILGGGQRPCCLADF